MSSLPIESLLGDIHNRLREKKRLVLAAPPGAGKTTRVPLALAGLIAGHEPLPGRIVMLEPRRIAARMAAERMAQTLGERVGQRIGLSTRVDRRVSKETVVEVITDGLFTRRILADPELSSISAVIFDEIHERGLNADLGLTLALESQSALREDLHLLVMSATLDTALMAERLKAPIIESEGRQYPVDTRYLGRGKGRFEDEVANAIHRALRETDGSLLVFLPGAGEIRRVEERLEVPPNIEVAPLFGALSPKEQDAAVQPAPPGTRKIVLSTDLAESALTIEGVSVVIDSGLSRVPETDASGFSRLQTVRVSRASADQRRGRAGRVGPGICYRLWDEAETRGLVAAPTPEIMSADLSGLVLALADWGETDPSRLTWLTPPPEGRLKRARDTLIRLNAITAEGMLSDIGREMANLPLPPRQAALIVKAETPGTRALGAQIAALISERGLGGNSPDLAERLARFERDTAPRAKTLRAQAARWADGAKPDGDPGEALAAAWPDMIARRRNPGSANYILASGRAGSLEEGSALSREEWIVVADMVGQAKQARITLAARLAPKVALAHPDIEEAEDASFEPSTGGFFARLTKRLGAIILSKQPLPKPSGEATRAAYLAYIAEHGFDALEIYSTVRTLSARTTFLHRHHSDEWPKTSIENLQAGVKDWLAPMLGSGAFKHPTNGQIIDAFKAHLGWPLAGDFDTLAPPSFELPTGRKGRIDWLDERAPLIECKPQELYGLRKHPGVANGRAPITLQLLSPGGKPVATTRDLPGFWSGGYQDMAKDMRGRYPKHDWPDDPASAKPHAGVTKARLAKG